ncbi:MAG: hypothetical protein AABX80_00475 [Nanoarchaeota archaeon]
MKKTYLKGEIVGRGMFSNEYIFKTKNYFGQEVEGFFNKCNIVDGKLRVTLAKDYGDSVSIITPQYFIGQGNIIEVNKKDITKHL